MAIIQNNAADNDEEAGLNEEQEALVVLVVDDEEDIRTVLRLTLTVAGYEVREAEDGERALESIHEDVPDLILVDVLMPGMDGFEVCRRVRDDSKTAHIPILMLSGKTDSLSRQEGMRAGATKYLTKPLAPAQLIQHVADALNNAAD